MALKVLVFAETREGVLKKSSREALGLARRLADSGGVGEVAAVLAVDSAGDLPDRLARAGADRIFLAENPLFSGYCPGGFAAAAVQAAAGFAPAVVILAGTALGKDLTPRISARLGVSAATDVISVDTDGGRITALRPAFGGKVQMRLSFRSSPAILCIRANVFQTVEVEGRNTRVEKLAVEPSAQDLALRITGVKKTVGERPDVAEADLVVSGGRGMKEGESFRLLEQLAATLGAGIGASRAAVDAGWRPHGDQVGQTGKFVSPTLYVACGISGAVQHLAGMIGSKVIVAINKDPDAPIFKVADFGVVGDVFEVIPALIEELKKHS